MNPSNFCRPMAAWAAAASASTIAKSTRLRGLDEVIGRTSPYPVTKATPEWAVQIWPRAERWCISTPADCSVPPSVLGVHLCHAGRGHAESLVWCGVLTTAEVFQPRAATSISRRGDGSAPLILPAVCADRAVQRDGSTATWESAPRPRCRWLSPCLQASPLSPTEVVGEPVASQSRLTAAHAWCPKSPLPDDRRPPGRW